MIDREMRNRLEQSKLKNVFQDAQEPTIICKIANSDQQYVAGEIFMCNDAARSLLKLGDDTRTNLKEIPEAKSVRFRPIKLDRSTEIVSDHSSSS